MRGELFVRVPPSPSKCLLSPFKSVAFDQVSAIIVSMRKTAKEIAESTNGPEKAEWISNATAEEIWQFLAGTPFPSHDFQTAITRLDILISKDLSNLRSQMTEVRKDISRVETRLEKTHNVHRWILLVAILTGVFALIAAWDVILKWIRGN